MSCYPTGFKKSTTRRRSSFMGDEDSDIPSAAMAWLERWSSKAANTFLDGLQCTDPSNGGSPSNGSPALSNWCPPDGEFGAAGRDMFLFQSNRDVSVLDDESAGSDDGSTDDDEDEEEGVYEFFHRQASELALRPMKFKSNPTSKEKMKMTVETGHGRLSDTTETMDDSCSEGSYYSACESPDVQKHKPTLEVIPEEQSRKHEGLSERGVAANSFETATTASLSESWSASSGDGSNSSQANSQRLHSPIAPSQCDSMLVNYDEHEEDEEVLDNHIRNDWGDGKNRKSSIGNEEWNNSSATTVLVSHIQKQRQKKLLTICATSPSMSSTSARSMQPEEDDDNDYRSKEHYQKNMLQKPSTSIYPMDRNNDTALTETRYYDC